MREKTRKGFFLPANNPKFLPTLNTKHCLLWSLDSAILGLTKVNVPLYPWRVQMSEQVDKASYFHSLLSKEQGEYLQKVREALDVPHPTPTEAELEEAHNAECR